MIDERDAALRRVVLVVGLLNLAYFAVEFVIAVAIGSVSLFADSVDFLEDASVNVLIFLAIAWSLRARARVGSVLAFVILVPAVATIVAAVLKIVNPTPPSFGALSLAALGALIVNLTCAVLLARHRSHPGGLARGLALGPKRLAGQCRDHSRCLRRTADPIRLARHHRGHRNRVAQRRRRTSGVAGGASGAPRCQAQRGLRLLTRERCP